MILLYRNVNAWEGMEILQIQIPHGELLYLFTSRSKQRIEMQRLEIHVICSATNVRYLLTQCSVQGRRKMYRRYGLILKGICKTEIVKITMRMHLNNIAIYSNHKISVNSFTIIFFLHVIFYSTSHT